MVDVCNALLESDSGLCRFIATTVQIKLRVIRERVYCYTVLLSYIYEVSGVQDKHPWPEN